MALIAAAYYLISRREAAQVLEEVEHDAAHAGPAQAEAGLIAIANS
ncbi:MAG TPA: hypothetical protein VMV10_20635 [Pirellulales bacterium]|nr:hypothetical protein [Pirellulales bacterium]